MWWEPSTQLIRLQVLRAISTTAARFTEENTLQGSLKIKDQPKTRISQVWTYFGQRNSLQPIDEPDNFRSVAVTANLEAETEYGGASIKKIFSRWIPFGGRSVATRLPFEKASRGGWSPLAVSSARICRSPVARGLAFRLWRSLSIAPDQRAMRPPSRLPRSAAACLPRFLIMFAMASLSACGLIRPNASWVDEMPEQHAASIAEIIATLTVERIPPGSKPLRLAPAPLTQSGDTLTAGLTSALKARGYRLATEETEGKGYDRLRYLVTTYEEGYLLRVTAGGSETSTLLKPGAGGQLVATAPLSVRKTAQ